MPRLGIARCPLPWIAAVGVILATRPAGAVIIDSGDGTGNTTAPLDDPGWDHLGAVGVLSGIYLGNGWMLTANHVSLATVTLAGSTWAPVIGSEIRLSNGDDTFADLKVFALHGLPDLPLLPIRTTTPAIGTPLVMAGFGFDRGAATSWNPPGPAGPYGGYAWALAKSLRWGTNRVDGYPLVDPYETISFFTSFDAGASEHEAQAATGDSGGAVWIHDGSGWELAGVLFAIDTYEIANPSPPPDFFFQPAGTALYGNLTYAADLSFYEEEISAIVALSEPESLTGLLAGGAFLGLLGRRRMRT